MVLRVTPDLMILINFERSGLVWVRDELVVAYPRDDFDQRKINVGGLGSWFLNWVDDEMKMCAW